MSCPHRLPGTLLLIALTLALPAALVGQSDAEAHAGHTSPYAGLTDRAIKAVSTEEAAGLAAGSGLGFALSAELNGVPGPLHVLEMAEEMGLRAGQADAIRVIETRMKERSRDLGARILELEGELDRRFAHGHATVEDVARLTGEIGSTRGELRATHLVAHLETAAVLDGSQIDVYRRMRGYPESREER